MLSQKILNQATQLDAMIRANTITPEDFQLFINNMIDIADQVAHLEANGMPVPEGMLNISSQKIGHAVILRTRHHDRPKLMRGANSNDPDNLTA